MKDHSNFTKMHLWMIQRAKKEVFGHRKIFDVKIQNSKSENQKNFKFKKVEIQTSKSENQKKSKCKIRKSEKVKIQRSQNSKSENQKNSKFKFQSRRSQIWKFWSWVGDLSRCRQSEKDDESCHATHNGQPTRCLEKGLLLIALDPASDSPWRLHLEDREEWWLVIEGFQFR